VNFQLNLFSVLQFITTLLIAPAIGIFAYRWMVENGYPNDPVLIVLIVPAAATGAFFLNMLLMFGVVIFLDGYHWINGTTVEDSEE